MSASPALQIEHPDVASWRNAFLALEPGRAPCPGLAGPKWQLVHAATIEFLDRYADKGAGYGWTTLQLFGVHPSLGVLRSGFCGALVLSGERVSGVEVDRMDFERGAYRRDEPGRPDGAIPIWAFKG